MKKISRWDMYFKEHKYPCIITNKDTYEIQYYNLEFKKILNIEEDAVLGTSFFDLVDMNMVHLEDSNPNWEENDSFETISYNKKYHRKFLLKCVKMEDGESIFCEMIPLENSPYDNIRFEKVVASCMEQFDGKGERQEIYTEVMKLMMEFYDGERAFVYNYDIKDSTINCIFQWSDDPTMRVSHEAEEKIDATLLTEWFDANNIDGVASASRESLERASQAEVELLEKFNLKNVTLCSVIDAENHIVGLVGVSDRRNEKAFLDRRLLQSVARVLGTRRGERKGGCRFTRTIL